MEKIKVVKDNVFCPLSGRKTDAGYCRELCNIGTDDILPDDDKVDDWDKALEICKECGIYY